MSFIKLEEETGEFLISTYGNGIAFGFKGDQPFLDRCLNLVKNFGICRNTYLSSLGMGGIYYVCSTEAKLRAALVEYYTGQCIIKNLVESVSSEDIGEGIMVPLRDDSEVSAKAESLTDLFLSKVVRSNFMYGITAGNFEES